MSKVGLLKNLFPYSFPQFMTAIEQASTMANSKLDEEYLIGSGGLVTPTSKLPRHVFHNKFTCALAKHKTWVSIIGGEIVFFPSLLALGIMTNNGILILFSIVLIILVVFFTFPVAAGTIAEFDKAVMTLTNQMHFLNQIIQQRPGIPMDKWDVIAANMNQLLYSNGSYPNPYYFFDGKACFSLFKALFLKSYSGEETQSSSTPYDERKPYIAKAVKVYQESVDSFWAQQVEGSSTEV